MTEQSKQLWLRSRMAAWNTDEAGVRQRMRDQGSKSDKSKVGFTNPEVASRAGRLGGQKSKKRGKNGLE